VNVLEEAAQRRAQSARAQSGPSYRAAADRPQQRRSEGGGAWSPAARSRIQLRGLDAGTGPLVFDGFASVTGQFYEMYDWAGPYKEQVHVGSFGETLAQPGLDVPLVLDHESSRRIARTVLADSTLTLSEVTEGDRTGLSVLAPNLDRNDPDVAYIAPKLRSGLIDEMSFRFMITSGRWSDDWSEYHIHAVDLNRGDVSIVGYGANPLTAGAGLRSQSRAAARATVRRDLRRVAGRLANRALSTSDAATLTALLVQLAAADSVLDPIVDALCETDCALDAAQMTLSSLLGLPDPDPEDAGMVAMSAPSAGASRARALLDLAIADR
jgi:HK97 family phage prohead protease